MLLLRAPLRYPFSPALTLRRLRDSGALLPFAAGGAIAISLLAGLRAGLMAGAVFSPTRFASSLLGFVLLPGLLRLGGRAVGQRAGWGALAAAVVGAGIPFLAVDAAWSLWLAGEGGDAIGRALWAFERLSWPWALWLLVAGVAEAMRVGRWRALGTVGLVAAGLALAVAAALALRPDRN